MTELERFNEACDLAWETRTPENHGELSEWVVTQAEYDQLLQEVLAAGPDLLFQDGRQKLSAWVVEGGPEPWEGGVAGLALECLVNRITLERVSVRIKP